MLAIIITFLIALIDGYHSWLYSKALSNAHNIEQVLSLYYASLARGDDDPQARREFEVAIPAHRFGRVSDIGKFHLKSLREPRPRLVILCLYVTLWFARIRSVCSGF